MDRGSDAGLVQLTRKTGEATTGDQNGGVAGGPDPQRSAVATAALTAELVKALNHPVRRSILRFLLQAGRTGRASSSDIRRRAIRYNAPTVLNHHLDALIDLGAVARVGGKTGSKAGLYSCTDAAQASWFLAVLELTAIEDTRVNHEVDAG